MLCCSSCTFTKPLSRFSKRISCSPELAALPDAVDAVSLGAEMPAADRGHVRPDAVRNLKRNDIESMIAVALVTDSGNQYLYFICSCF